MSHIVFKEKQTQNVEGREWQGVSEKFEKLAVVEEEKGKRSYWVKTPKFPFGSS